MSVLMQWIHLVAAVVGIGGLGFIHMILIPASRDLEPEQRDLLFKRVSRKFQYVIWSVVLLLITSGLYSIHAHAWERPWGVYWKMADRKDRFGPVRLFHLVGFESSPGPIWTGSARSGRCGFPSHSPWP